MSRSITLKVFSAAGNAWQRTFEAARQMPAMFLVALAAFGAVNFAFLSSLQITTADFSGPASLLRAMASVLLDLLAVAFLGNLLALIVLRWELLSEKPSRETFPGPAKRHFRFALLTILLMLVYAIPRLITVAVAGAPLHNIALPFGPAMALLFFGYAASLLLFLVCMPLLAALSVDSAGATFGNATADTGPGIARIFLLWLAVSLPVWLLDSAITWELLNLAVLVRADISVAISQSVFFILWVTAISIASAHVYRCYGEKLGSTPANRRIFANDSDL